MPSTGEDETLSAEGVGVETAWRTHAHLTDWISKADNKASFAMSIGSAVLAGVIAISGKGELLGNLEGGALAGYRLGVALLAVGILISVMAVFPQLRRSPAQREWKTGLIYFGHLRHWESSRLTEELTDADLLPALASQLVALSVIAWRKHCLLQWSFGAAALGTILVALTGLAANL